MTPEIDAVLDVLAGRVPSVEGDALVGACALLQANGVAGLAVAEARGRGDAGLLDGLRDAYRYQALHTTVVLESGARAVEALAGAGIEVLPFKGMALFRAGVYTDPGARAMEDVDLLVAPGDVERAVGVLEGVGFRPWSPWDPRRLTWLSSFTLTDALAPGGMEPSLDLHWATPYARLRLAGPWPRDPLWEGAVDGVPGPEAHFVLVAEHVLKHLRVLSHLRGVADLVRLAPLLQDGDQLVRQARRRGSLRGLRTVVAFLGDGLGVALPPAVVDAVGRGRGARKAARRHLDPTTLVGPSGPSRGALGGLVGSWGLIGSPWETLGEWVRVLAPSGRWLRDRYPETPAAARRLVYLGAVAAWVTGRGASPLSPNQEWAS